MMDEKIKDKLKNFRERVYFKIPGKEAVDVTLISGKKFAIHNPFLVRKLLKKNKRKTYTDIHNHPSIPGVISLSSPGDFGGFLISNRRKGMVVSQQNPDSGYDEGYFYFRKTKNTPIVCLSGILNFFLDDGEAFSKMKSNLKDYSEMLIQNPKKAVEYITNKYNLNYRFIPAEGFQYDNQAGSFVRD